MKTRNLFLFFSFLLSAVLFVSCSENTVTGGEDDPTPKVVTKFTSGNPSPDNIFGPFKTLMDNAGNHYWTEGDHIWVKSGSTYYKDVENTILSTQAVADFSIPGALTDNTYEVFYVGQNSPQASSSTANTLKVTIAATQHQPIPNNAEHFGRSGDCGTATATKVSSGSSSVNNEYSFRLNHRAAYLVFAPKDPNIEKAGKAKLKKIKVESDNAICGTYDFTTGHLTNGTSTGNTITLEVGEEFDGVTGQDFPIPATQDVRTNGAFMVIQPGTHALTITYTVEYYGITQEITKTVSSREFLENKYYTVGHTLNVEIPEFMFDFPDTYYLWDAKQWYWYGQKLDYFPVTPSPNDANRWYNTVIYDSSESALACDGQYSCKGYKDDGTGYTPNVNDLTWYCVYGDPHWDNVTEWYLGGYKYTGGLWLKKKDVIKAENPGVTGMFVRYLATKADKSGTDGDWRTKVVDGGKYSVTQGKPSPAELEKYFFLPALGLMVGAVVNGAGTVGYYWSSSPAIHNFQSNGYIYSYCLAFNNSYVAIWGYGKRYDNLFWGDNQTNRGYGMVAGHRPDGTTWFQ